MKAICMEWAYRVGSINSESSYHLNILSDVLDDFNWSEKAKNQLIKNISRRKHMQTASLEDYQVINDKISPKPYVGLFRGIGRQKWEWWQVVSELIDNTITISGKTDVKIIVDTVKNTFTINDNSIGIPGSELEDVITIGKQVNLGKQLLSYSGVGLKTAIYWMGHEFEIETKSSSDSNDYLYKLTPNFSSKDQSDMPAEFTLSHKEGKDVPSGTTVKVKDLKHIPRKKSTIEQAVIYLGATYADFLEEGKLTISIEFVQKNGITHKQVKPVRPLLTNKENIIVERYVSNGTEFSIGENTPEKEDTLKGDAGNGWEVRIRAGRKLYPEAATHYLNESPELYYNVYDRENNSPYAWSAKTAGVNFKMLGKILLFNQEGASSRAESLWCEVDCIRGIKPAMTKNLMDTSSPEYAEMLSEVNKYLEKNKFKFRVKTGLQHYTENVEVRDKFVEVIKENELLRQEWGVSLDKFDSEVSTESTIEMGRPDIFIRGSEKTVIVECKNEEIKAIDVSQAVGYAVETNADQVVLVAQRITVGGQHALQMWRKKLNIQINFMPIQKHYRK